MTYDEFLQKAIDLTGQNLRWSIEFGKKYLVNDYEYKILEIPHAKERVSKTFEGIEGFSDEEKKELLVLADELSQTGYMKRFQEVEQC